MQSLKAEIIVVDNASSDGSIEYLLDKFSEVIFIDNPRNLGFAKANNQALKQARGEFILFLNPDTIVPEDCLESCIQLFQSDSQIGACGVKMIDGSGEFLPESKRAFPSVQTSFYKLSGLTSLFPRSKTFAKYHLGHLSKEKNNEIDVLSGAYFMVRKAVLDKTGGFDERFFMYGEDIDLSYRIQQAGFKNFYFSETCIVHFKGESTAKGSRDYVKMFYKAMSLFVEKHYKGSNPKAFIFLIESSIWFRASLSVIKNIFLKEKKNIEPAIIDTLIIANEESKKRIELILKKQDQQRKSIYLTTVETLKTFLLSNKPDEIIFAEGTMSYKQIISCMQHIPGITIGIFSNNSRSIVGSSSKNSNGQMLV